MTSFKNYYHFIGRIIGKMALRENFFEKDGLKQFLAAQYTNQQHQIEINERSGHVIRTRDTLSLKDLTLLFASTGVDECLKNAFVMIRAVELRARFAGGLRGGMDVLMSELILSNKMTPPGYRNQMKFPTRTFHTGRAAGLNIYTI